MDKKTSAIELSKEDRAYLELQTRAGTIQAQTVNGARIVACRCRIYR